MHPLVKFCSAVNFTLYSLKRVTDNNKYAASSTLADVAKLSYCIYNKADI